MSDTSVTTNITKTAREIMRLKGYQGDARVFECNPPMPWSDWDSAAGDYVAQEPLYYVIVSAASVMFSGPETYIFPAKREGEVFEVADWSELNGSFKGGLDHAKALENAGYEVRP